jgi:hypothetical protein
MGYKIGEPGNQVIRLDGRSRGDSVSLVALKQCLLTLKPSTSEAQNPSGNTDEEDCRCPIDQFPASWPTTLRIMSWILGLLTVPHTWGTSSTRNESVVADSSFRIES